MFELFWTKHKIHLSINMIRKFIWTQNLDSNVTIVDSFFTFRKKWWFQFLMTYVSKSSVKRSRWKFTRYSELMMIIFLQLILFSKPSFVSYQLFFIFYQLTHNCPLFQSFNPIFRRYTAKLYLYFSHHLNLVEFGLFFRHNCTSWVGSWEIMITSFRTCYADSSKPYQL